MGGPRDPLGSSSASLPWSRTKGQGKGPCLTKPSELPPTTLGRKPVMLVWTVAVLTQFESTLKEDRKVENTRRKKSACQGAGRA